MSARTSTRTGSLKVLTRPNESLGFRLAGATVEEIPVGDEAARVRAIVSDPALCILAIEEDVLRAVPAAILHVAEERVTVLPFSLPRHWGEVGRGQEYVAALIRRAIGYHIKLGPGGER